MIALHVHNVGVSMAQQTLRDDHRRQRVGTDEVAFADVWRNDAQVKLFPQALKAAPAVKHVADHVGDSGIVHLVDDGVLFARQMLPEKLRQSHGPAAPA